MAETTYQTVTQREAPDIEARKLALMAEARRLYETPMTLPAIEAAGLSIGEQQAMDLARQGIGSFEPFIQGGSQAITQGMDLTQRGALAAGAIQTAPMFQQAQNVLGQGINTLAPMADYERLAGAGLQDIGAGIGRVARAGDLAGSYMQADLRPALGSINAAQMAAMQAAPSDFRTSSRILGSGMQGAAGATQTAQQAAQMAAQQYGTATGVLGEGIGALRGAAQAYDPNRRIATQQRVVSPGFQDRPVPRDLGMRKQPFSSLAEQQADPTVRQLNAISQQLGGLDPQSQEAQALRNQYTGLEESIYSRSGAAQRDPNELIGQQFAPSDASRFMHSEPIYIDNETGMRAPSSASQAGMPPQFDDRAAIPQGEQRLGFSPGLQGPAAVPQGEQGFYDLSDDQQFFDSETGMRLPSPASQAGMRQPSLPMTESNDMTFETPIEAFMNPYQQAVTQQGLQEMRRQADIARQGMAAQAVGSGAFGGTREGVQRAEFERNVQDQMQRRSDQDLAQNFAQAQAASMQSFESQQQRQLAQAQGLQQAAGLSGQLTGQQAQVSMQAAAQRFQQAGFDANTAMQMAQLQQAQQGQGLQQAGALQGIGALQGQLAGQQAQIGQAGSQLVGQLGAQQAQLGLMPSQIAQSQAGIGAQRAGLYGQLGQGIGALTAQQAGIDLNKAQALGGLGVQMGSLGTQMGAMGEATTRLGAADVGMLGSIGLLERQNEQAQMDAIRQTQMQETMDPFQRLGFVSDIYRGAPSTQMSMTAQTAPSASPLQSAVGLGVAGLSSAAAAKTAGLF